MGNWKLVTQGGMLCVQRNATKITVTPSTT